MDDDDDAAPAVTNRRPHKAWSDSKAFRRLQRELRGGGLRWDPRFHTPAETYCETPDRSEHAYWLTSSKRVLKPVRLDLLHGQHELRDYIILGEKPTFPHQLVTICRPHQSSLGFVPSNSENGLKAGSICYWALDLASRSIKEVASVASVDYYASSFRFCDDYSLSAAFTAWDIDHDKLAQVLVWDFAVEGILDRPSGPDQLIWQKLEFRYGAESVIVDHNCTGERPVAIGACFAGLPGTQKGVNVRVLFPRKMILFEPFGGAKPRSPTAAEFWKPALETSAGSGGNTVIPPPLITTIDLSRIAASHLKAVLKSYADAPPRFTYAHAAFIPASRPVRFGPGERERFDRRCTLAFGAVEARSRMYHLFVIALDAAAHTHRVLVAKAFSSSVVFCWENMVAAEAADLLVRALERVVSVRKGRHDCRVDCEPVVGGLRGFEEFGLEVPAVEGICMRELGVVLKGWGAKGA